MLKQIEEHINSLTVTEQKQLLLLAVCYIANEEGEDSTDYLFKNITKHGEEAKNALKDLDEEDSEEDSEDNN